MRYRIFPGTTLSVSEIGFGTWTLSTGWWGEKTDEQAVESASLAGLRGISPGQAAYCASKHGVVGLTRQMALELAPHGIRVLRCRQPFTQFDGPLNPLLEKPLVDGRGGIERPDPRPDL